MLFIKNGNIIVLKIRDKYGFRRNIELHRGIGNILSLILWHSRIKNEENVKVAKISDVFLYNTFLNRFGYKINSFRKI